MIAKMLSQAISSSGCNCLECRKKRFEREWDKYVRSRFDGFKPCYYDRGHKDFPAMPTFIRRRYVDYEADYKLMLQTIEQVLEGDKKLNVYRTRCYDCGASILKSKSVPARKNEGNIYYCKKCSDRHIICSDCRAATPRTRPQFITYDMHNGKKICSKCFKDKYYMCFICSNSYVRGTDKALQMENGELKHICLNCYKQYVTKCPQCHGDVLSDNTKIYRGRRICIPCFKIYTRMIQAHNFKPAKFQILSSKRETCTQGTLLFGVELEIEPVDRHNAPDREDMALRLLDFIGRDKCLIKHDGTVRHGLELVLYPFSWMWFRENKKAMHDIFAYYLKNGYSASYSGNAGMHVHMSKSAFSTFHIWKYLKMIYNDDMRKYLHIIAQRPPRSDGVPTWHYAKFKREDTGYRGMIKTAKDKCNPSGARHSAVSLMYSPTIELRIFGGTDIFTKFCANLEFCKSLYEYTQQCKPKYLDPYYYTEYITQRVNNNKFPNLIKYLRENKEFALAYPSPHNLLYR